MLMCLRAQLQFEPHLPKRPLYPPALAPQILRFKEAAASNFTTASFEGSTHYVLESKWLASQLRDLFPWLKIGGC